MRVDDKLALVHAAGFARELRCIYCHDSDGATVRFGTPRLGPHRSEFIGQSLLDLAGSLAEHGQQPLVFHDRPEDVIARLVETWRVDRIVASRQSGYDENRRRAALREHLAGVRFVEIETFTLFERDPTARLAEFPPTFSKFRRVAEKHDLVVPVGPPDLPPPPALQDQPRAFERVSVIPVDDFCGGEAAARCRLDEYFGSDVPSRYRQTRNELDGRLNSTRFSPWLATGCLSVRRLCQRLRDYEDEHGANDSTYWTFSELRWREFFQWYARRHGARLFQAGGLPGRRSAWPFDRGRFESWCQGRTPWPLVNACMRQLDRIGYLSNRGRQIVASTLINELGLGWRAGAGYFENRLIDYDVAPNWGNWQYIADVGAYPRGGRHFDLDRQFGQFDPDGNLVRKWPGSGVVPERADAFGDFPEAAS